MAHFSMALQRIKRELEELRANDEPDEGVFEQAALLLDKANEIAIAAGLDFRPAPKMTTPAKALVVVNRLLIESEPERYLLVGEAAKILSVSQDKISEWIKASRLEAVNVANPGKRPQYRIPRDALNRLLPERKYKPKFL